MGDRFRHKIETTHPDGAGCTMTLYAFPEDEGDSRYAIDVGDEFIWMNDDTLVEMITWFLSREME